MSKESLDSTSQAQCRDGFFASQAEPEGEPSEETFPAEWKPKAGTKAQKLARIRPPEDYPSEAEFDQHAEEMELVWPEYRPDIYSALCDRKWHHWNERIGRWSRIRDWREYVEALDRKISRED